ncbi:MAG: T9SS type A sorting domain-containing protein [Prevotellaceae bacterium]|jgi:hypothetical protein|nr:T9SS type A sorting domain-containing protein [Prevotellaceae bacterium]
MADEAVDYYVVATTYNNYQNNSASTYQVAIWTGATEPDATEPQYPVVPEIISTSASAAQIIVAQNVTLPELKGALLALGITATLDNGDAIPVANNPFAWTFNASNTQTRYENIHIVPYTVADGYQAAVVEIRYLQSALNEQSANALLLYPNPAVETVSISGLAGGETISILDLNGKIIAQTTAKGETANFAVSSLAKGVYLVAVQGGGKATVLKFVK